MPEPGTVVALRRYPVKSMLGEDLRSVMLTPSGLEGDRVVTFQERSRNGAPSIINAGVYVFDPATTALLPDVGDHEDTTFPMLARENRLFAYRITTTWRGIDTVKDLNEAAKAMA